MTEQPNDNKSVQLSEADIVNYLQQHPDFFTRHDDVLLNLRLTHPSGKAISLIEHQLNRLRHRSQELQKQLTFLLDTARENERLFEKTRLLILQLIEADNLESLTAALEDNLRHNFKVEAVSFMLFKPLTNHAARSLSFEDAQEKLGPLLSTDSITAGQYREPIIQFLFGPNTSVKSIAFMPLTQPQHYGFLALGSSNAKRYQRETGTLFLQYLGDILCRLLPRFC